MQKSKLNQKEQIEKLSFLTGLANKKRNGDLTDKLSAIVIFHGLVEFHAIQAARLLEQIVLKYQLAQGKRPSFQPHQDEYFYNRKVSTRKILKVTKKFLPFHNEMDPQSDKSINEKVRNFLIVSDKFLDYRNAIIHGMGSPNTSLEDIRYCCDEALSYYEKVLTAQKEMFVILQPYRFSQKEINHFYGNRR